MKRLKSIDYVKAAISYGDVSKNNGRVKVKRGVAVKSLCECVSDDRDRTELYIVEGDSAGGSLISCRDPKVHAVLPLRGKPINAACNPLDHVVRNAEFQALIRSIGSGVAPLEQIEKVRYGKIIIAADADPDGKNIEAILLGGFLTLFPSLVHDGRLFICEAPLFRQGQRYFWSFEDINPDKPFKRFKGLGEMNSDEIHESMVDPKNRRLIQVVISDESDRSYGLKLVGDRETRRLMLLDRGVI